MDWFLYDNGLRHERVKHKHDFNQINFPKKFSRYNKKL